MTNRENLDLLLAELDLLKTEIMIYTDTLCESLSRQLAVEYCFESNRLEGSSMSLRETHMVLSVGLSGKSMQDNLTALNHYKTIEFIREQAEEQTLLSEALIQQLHIILSRAMEREHAGQYRDQPITITGTRLFAPEPAQLPTRISANMQWLRLEGPFIHPVIYAAEAHLRLQALQPFRQANGLCARLTMNLILLSENYPMANIPGDETNRQRYYQTLENTLETGDNTLWYEMIAKQAIQDSKNLLARLK